MTRLSETTTRSSEYSYTAPSSVSCTRKKIKKGRTLLEVPAHGWVRSDGHPLGDTGRLGRERASADHAHELAALVEGPDELLHGRVLREPLGAFRSAGDNLQRPRLE